MKRMLALLIVMVVSLLYVACGNKSSGNLSEAAASPSESAQMNIKKESMNLNDGEGGANTGSALLEQQMPSEDRKIIYDCTLRMEATNFEATQKALAEAVKGANGYVANTSLENGTNEGAMRYATYGYRIPIEQYAAFLTLLGNAGNVTSQQENAQDITVEYVDVEARLKSLQTQEERLMQMLEEAGNLETMLAIQNQLTEVQYRLESYTAQQRTYDSLVEYCTVTVYVQEVKHATESKITFVDRASAAFRESWRDFGEGCKSFAVGAIYFLPTLLVLAALCVLTIFLVHVMQKRTKTRCTARAAQNAQPQQPSAMPTIMVQAPLYNSAHSHKDEDAPQK